LDNKIIDIDARCNHEDWKDNIQRKLNVIREHCHYISVTVSAMLKCFEADLVAVY